MIHDVDVLVVGAGPTGLMLASELAAFGLSLRIVDKELVRSDKSRALLVQGRGIELLDRYGLGAAIVARGTLPPGIDVHVHGQRVASLDIGDIAFDDMAFPPMVIASQADTEALLEAHLLAALGPGHRGIERPASVRDMDATTDGVTVQLVHGVPSSAGDARPPRVETLRCRYLVGCDGAHSSVRHAANIAFEGDAYHMSFGLADVRVQNWPERPVGRVQMFWGKGFSIVLPYDETEGIVRLVAC